MAKKRGQPGPWRIRYLQVNDKGVMSRPRIEDANGHPVNGNQKGNAALMAASPEMLALLVDLADKVEFFYLMLKSEHPGLVRPDCLEAARRLLARIEANST